MTNSVKKQSIKSVVIQIFCIYSGVIVGTLITVAILGVLGVFHDLFFSPICSPSSYMIAFEILNIIAITFLLIVTIVILKIGRFRFPVSRLNNIELGVIFAVFVILTNCCLAKYIKIFNTDLFEFYLSPLIAFILAGLLDLGLIKWLPFLSPRH